MMPQILGFQMAICQHWARSPQATQIWMLKIGPCSLPGTPSITACKMAVVVWPASLCMAPCQPQQIIPSSITRCSALHHIAALQQSLRTSSDLCLSQWKQKSSTFHKWAFKSMSSLEMVI